jgi:hypothetical protein
MSRTDLVIAVRHRQQGMGSVYAPSQEFEQIEGRLVRPMHILEDGQGRPRSCQLLESGTEDRVAVLRVDSRQQAALGLPGNIEQRGERPRCEERVARPPQHPGGALTIAEFLQQ